MKIIGIYPFSTGFLKIPPPPNKIESIFPHKSYMHKNGLYVSLHQNQFFELYKINFSHLSNLTHQESFLCKSPVLCGAIPWALQVKQSPGNHV